MDSIKLEDGIFLQRNEGFTTIFDYNNSLYYSLDEVASDILKYLLEEESVEEAVNQMILTYEVDREKLLLDCKRLIEQLENEKILRVSYVK
ncbi:PqqD family protein [Bacillus sp. NTK074B]|uniref:PqqD family protein n=1 Tax=Bacillus sp. NTK074B TaxID=2802174 RepID=UPI001A8C8AD9|nr:PqqD family protein [Bacillus sp. NTK074B]